MIKPTITNANRFCLNCGSGPLTGNAKQKFCSPNCRTNSFRKNQSLTILGQNHELEQHKAIIQELHDAPIKRTESVRKINADRQVAQQAFDAQKARCNKLEKQVTINSNVGKALTLGNAGAHVGAIAGGFFVLVLMSLRYDNREKESIGIGTAFPVISAICLIAMIFIGYHCGRFIHCELIAGDEEVHSKLDLLIAERQPLEFQLKIERTHLEELGRRLNQIPHYESQTIICIEEAKTLSLVTD